MQQITDRVALKAEYMVDGSYIYLVLEIEKTPTNADRNIAAVFINVGRIDTIPFHDIDELRHIFNVDNDASSPVKCMKNDYHYSYEVIDNLCNRLNMEITARFG